ncbi:hypothetical protein [Microvirga aerophila]|uniref:Uncharacterized protein n=1 Tax=Microvirga aerophila TaxID=670291 RepID=A0A512C1T2_9HYPH|nr:hypothetical protein [Microvirga aerophila]GEO18171.1 hypothetical protein MAE02_58670 [Microvirga aerophila]
MDDLMRWACSLLGFSGCYGFSPWEMLLYASGFTLIAFFVGFLVVAFVLGWFTR